MDLLEDSNVCKTVSKSVDEHVAGSEDGRELRTLMPPLLRINRPHLGQAHEVTSRAGSYLVDTFPFDALGDLFGLLEDPGGIFPDEMFAERGKYRHENQVPEYNWRWCDRLCSFYTTFAGERTGASRPLLATGQRIVSKHSGHC